MLQLLLERVTFNQGPRERQVFCKCMTVYGFQTSGQSRPQHACGMAVFIFIAKRGQTQPPPKQRKNRLGSFPLYMFGSIYEYIYIYLYIERGTQYARNKFETTTHDFFCSMLLRCDLLAKKVPGYHDPQLDVNELKHNRITLSFKPKIADKQINKLNRRRRWQKSVGPKLVQGEDRKNG